MVLKSNLNGTKVFSFLATGIAGLALCVSVKPASSQASLSYLIGVRWCQEGVPRIVEFPRIEGDRVYLSMYIEGRPGRPIPYRIDRQDGGVVDLVAISPHAIFPPFPGKASPNGLFAIYSLRPAANSFSWWESEFQGDVGGQPTMTNAARETTLRRPPFRFSRCPS